MLSSVLADGAQQPWVPELERGKRSPRAAAKGSDPQQTHGTRSPNEMQVGKLPKCFICTLPRGGTWFWWFCCLQQAQPLLQGRQRARHRAAPAPVEPTSSFPFCSAKLSAPKGRLWGLWQALQIAGSVVRGDKGPGEHQARGRWVRRAVGVCRWEAQGRTWAPTRLGTRRVWPLQEGWRMCSGLLRSSHCV